MVRGAGQRLLRSTLHSPGKAPDHLEVSHGGVGGGGYQATSRTLHALPGVPGGWIWTCLRRKPAPTAGSQMVRGAREGRLGSW